MSKKGESSGQQRAEEVLEALRAEADPERAAHSLGFFKCGSGEYGEGDHFLGVTVPAQRAIARRFRNLSLKECEGLLDEEYHEARLTGLIILTLRMGEAHKDPELLEAIVSLYLSKTDRVNNWDLVDTSAPKILGPYLEERDRSILDRLAASHSLWENRIAMLTTQHLIRRGETGDALRIAEKLVDHPHDLMHKAVGWMLREVGDRDRDALERFLLAHRETMPRTCLRYALEHLPKEERERHMRRGSKRG
jgi:3-methyladenine DNA glycosylase AlkD